MPSDLPRIGPTIPEVRDYVTDVGVIVVNYAHLERSLLHTIESLEEFDKRGVLPLPDAFKAIRDKPGKRTLGRLIEELKAIGVNSDTAQRLGQVNADRISVVHKAARLTNGESKLDLPAIYAERLRMRKLLKREQKVFGLIQQAQHDIFLGLTQRAEASLGPADPRIIAMHAHLRLLRAVIEHQHQRQ